MPYTHLDAWLDTADSSTADASSTALTADTGGLSGPALVEERINRILTQYRESPRLLGILRHDLEAVADIIVASFSLPDAFDINSATGDQLTLVGKRLGWPRCHCVCTIQPVFGFSCGQVTPNQPIVGFCEGGSWFGCNEAGTTDYCFADDEVYRNYLLARRYQALQLWDIESLQDAAAHLWGASASVVNMGGGRVAVSPGRSLTLAEQTELPLAFRVLPIAPGIKPHVSLNAGPVFGFGAGWAGLCESAEWFCPTPIDPYTCS